METTTIQVRKEQAEALKDIARENGNYKTVIDRLLESYNETISGESAVDESEIARNVATDLKAELPEAIAEQLR